MDMIVDRILSDVLHEGLKENLIFRDPRKDVSILSDRDRPGRSERGRSERGSPSKKRGPSSKHNSDSHSPTKKQPPEVGLSAEGGRSRSPSPFR